jgi:hypothetical protein
MQNSEVLIFRFSSDQHEMLYYDPARSALENAALAYAVVKESRRRLKAGQSDLGVAALIEDWPRRLKSAA